MNNEKCHKCGTPSKNPEGCCPLLSSDEIMEKRVARLEKYVFGEPEIKHPCISTKDDLRVSEIVNIETSTEIYYNIDNDTETLMVESKLNKLSIGFEEGSPVVRFGNVTVAYSRVHLAKMLWAAAYLVDSNETWKADEYVGRDY